MTIRRKRPDGLLRELAPRLTLAQFMALEYALREGAKIRVSRNAIHEFIFVSAYKRIRRSERENVYSAMTNAGFWFDNGWFGTWQLKAVIGEAFFTPPYGSVPLWSYLRGRDFAEE